MNPFVLAVGLTVSIGFIAADASAQHGSIIGKVVDQSGQPVADAVVKVVSPTDRTRPFDSKTNGKGEFGVVTAQIAGPWELTITKPGYAEYKHPDQILAPLSGSPTSLGTITLPTPGAASKKVVSPEEYAKLEAQGKALQAQFKQAVQLTEEAEVATAAGDSATASQKYDQALSLYNEMIAKNPDIAELHHNAGYILGRKKAWTEAAEAFVKAGSLAPTMANDYALAGTAYQNSGQRAKAIEVMIDGAQRNPSDVRIRIALGEAYYNGAQYADASAAFKKAQELDPAAPDPLYFLGMIAVSQGQTQECVTLLEKYLALNPSNSDHVRAAKGVIGALKPAKR